ncbi:N-acetylmuramidase domain-containing protein [Oceaniradius stylonematis]|uniref:N-acetylmuramidase domain-containing protein n=1 Tax=Oceaniradius stylonematis TaxID=2184161 RepID=UPI00273D61CE|nr:N-acetylmuramidase domain-containing protein [Oceaniradius stylonematis]
MAAFSDETLQIIERVARDNGIEPAALKAVAEVESGGRAFAYVGGRKEPLIRFEGHYFDRLVGEHRRAEARSAGLASPRAGAVKNPRGQAGRWQMLERAARIDRAAALQSVSWGIGQVMGAHWKHLGFGSPEALAREARSGIEGQVRLMLRFIHANRLTSLLHARDWAGFARRYNGPAYAKNRYDVRLAAAHARHRDGRPSSVPATSKRGRRGTLLRRGDRGDAVRDMQRMLTAAGHPLRADGVFGLRTEAALRAFQSRHGLAIDGIYGPASRAALSDALPKFGSWRGLLTFVARLVAAWSGLRRS